MRLRLRWDCLRVDSTRAVRASVPAQRSIALIWTTNDIVMLLLL
jgi:hypothetical protein